MALPTFQAAGAVASGVGAVSPAWPAHQAGDIALLITETMDFSSGDALTGHFRFTDMAGFREVACSPQQFGSSSFDPIPKASGDSGEIRVFWKRATTSAEPSPTIGDSGDHNIAIIITFRGGAPSGYPFHKEAAFTSTVQQTAWTIPGFTTTQNDCLIIDIVGAYGPESWSGWTNAALGSVTERVDAPVNVSNAGTIGVATGTMAVAGAIGTTAVTVSASVRVGGMKLALSSVAQPVHLCPWLANVGDVVESAVGNITVPWPPHQTDDVALLVVESGGWPMTLATPAGFTEVTNSPQLSGSSGTAGASGLSVWWCRATSGAMASPVVSFIADHIKAVILTYRGCIQQGTPINASAGNALVSAAQPVTIPSVTTAKNDSRAVFICTHSLDQTEAVFMNEANTGGALDRITGLVNHGDLIGSGSGLFVAHGRQAVAGATGTVTTSNLNATSQQARLSLALSPVSSDLIAETTNYALTLESASLLHNSNIIAGATTYTATINDAGGSVVHGYVLPADAIILGLTVSDSGLSKLLSGGWTREDPIIEDGWVKQPPLED